MAKDFQGSFIDWMRRRHGLSTPALYNKLGWDRVRYYNFCSRRTECSRETLWDLSCALGMDIYEVFKEECRFYFGKRDYARKTRERASREQEKSIQGPQEEVEVATHL